MSDFGFRAPSGFIAAFLFLRLVSGWFAGIVLAASAAVGGGGSGAAGWEDCFSRDALQRGELCNGQSPGRVGEQFGASK